MQTITLAGGCFWCTEALFSIVDGVENIQPGYTGGFVVNPTYEQVLSGRTGHVEAVQVTFDSKITSLEKIFKIFFTIHDPTSVNRQDADVGTQYRSAIFYNDKKQKETAEKVISALNKQGIWNTHIVTIVEPLKIFYFAESYHKEYYKKNPKQGYCRAVIAPKLMKLRQRYLNK